MTDHVCDRGYCMSYDWSRDSIEHLRREHEAAQKIYDRMAAFDEWLTAEPRDRVPRTVSLWNETVRLSAARRAVRGTK